MFDLQGPFDTGQSITSDGAGHALYAETWLSRPRSADEVENNRWPPAEAIAVLDLRDVQGLDGPGAGLGAENGTLGFDLNLMPYLLRHFGAAPIVVYKLPSLVERERRDPAVRRAVQRIVDDRYEVRVISEASFDNFNPGATLPLHPKPFRFVAPRFRLRSADSP
ncbi:MAG TPA: hypothetical protein VHC70_11640 [Phycisphaerales bacterium]|nr:hypothetical protein [Phycisphaerales bacterium]